MKYQLAYTRFFAAMIAAGASLFLHSYGTADISDLLDTEHPPEAAIHFPDRSRVVCQGTWQKTWDGTAAESRHAIESPTVVEVVATYRLGSEPGEIIVTQHAALKNATGLAGVEWVVDNIPLDHNIIVPGYSGIKMTQTTPGARHDFEYPISWEAQMVLIEGKERGFVIWAEDVVGCFKQLTVERTASGWRLGFITQTNAPFANQSECTSPPWHIAPFAGDWRVGAKKYRNWMWAHFQPTPVSKQTPAWAGDIRCCVIMGLDLSLLDGLAQRLDPAQTMLYLPDWRQAGYDRDYPTYDKVVPALEPFVARAHELGFRIMLHVNYFGVDPLNPLFPQFEPYQIRSAWDSHEPQWWVWMHADPIIKFAYINPACAAWRACFVERMRTLVQTTKTDALHLDQTLFIMNDHNGLVDGMTMLEGNFALHQELRAALPEVALSGEGLNEITFRQEAFAQRHVMGIYHSEGTFNERYIAMAHPISSYLFRDCTVIYGYLGCTPPEDGQNYAAWGEAYRHWGVIPTLKPHAASLMHPERFAQHFFSEADAWQTYRLNPDMDGDWPSTTVFPLRGVDGISARYTDDRKLTVGDKTIIHVLKGVSEYEGAGNISGWKAYSDTSIIGLDPARWYALNAGDRNGAALHVAQLPQDFILASLYETPELAAMRTGYAAGATLRLVDKIGEALCTSRPFGNSPTVTVQGDLRSPDGGTFEANGDILNAHPVWRVPGSGTAEARFSLSLPADVTDFISGVYVEMGASVESTSDGVVFSAHAESDGIPGKQVELMVLPGKERDLMLDVRAFAGKTTSITLRVDPGPAQNPSFDWARWRKPRIERGGAISGAMVVSGLGSWQFALMDNACIPLEGRHEETFTLLHPGGVYLLHAYPAVMVLPMNLTEKPYSVTVLDEEGHLLSNAEHAAAVVQAGTVGGVSRPGFFMHPPERGRIQADFVMHVAPGEARIETAAGLRDGCSEGALFIIEANGHELARANITPGEWHPMSATLDAYTGRPFVLSLIVDAKGSFKCDWAHWAEPVLR